MSEHTPGPWTAKPGVFWVCDIGNNAGDPGIWSTQVPPEGVSFPFGEKEADRDRIIACVNAFHSPDGRTIATEDIAEGTFWSVYRFMEWAAWQPCTCPDDDPCMSCQACDAINSLNVQGPEK